MEEVSPLSGTRWISNCLLGVYSCLEHCQPPFSGILGAAYSDDNNVFYPPSPPNIYSLSKIEIKKTAITRESADSDMSLDLRKFSITCYATVHDMDRKKIIGTT